MGRYDAFESTGSSSNQSVHTPLKYGVATDIIFEMSSSQRELTQSQLLFLSQASMAPQAALMLCLDKVGCLGRVLPGCCSQVC